jgi:hypothetical protein
MDPDAWTTKQFSTRHLVEFEQHLTNFLEQLEAKYAGNREVHGKVREYQALLLASRSLFGQMTGPDPRRICNMIVDAMYQVRHRIVARDESYFLRDITLDPEDEYVTENSIELYTLVKRVWDSPETTKDTKHAVWGFLHVILYTGCRAGGRTVDFDHPKGRGHKHHRHHHKHKPPE